MLTVGTDTYVSLDDANAYMAARVQSDTWAAATAAEQEKVLQDALRHFEALDPAGWEGFPRYEVGSPQQLLQWPRYSVPDRRQGLRMYFSPIPGMGIGFYDSETMPDLLKWAHCEEALELLEIDNDPAYHEAKRHQGRNVKRISLSRGKSVEYGDPYALYGGVLYSREAYRLIQSLRRTSPSRVVGLW